MIMNFERSDDIKVNLQLGKRPLITNWLNTMDVKNYTINPDLTIDVKGDVHLAQKNLIEFPEYIKFNTVSGNFWCDDNEVESFKGFPLEIGGSFSCTNNQIKSFEGKPKIIKGNIFF